MSFHEFSKLENSLGIVVSGEQFHFLLKNDLTQNKLAMFDFVNLDAKQVITETLGEDLSNYIFESITNGKRILEMENARERIMEIELPLMTIKTSS